ncbi:MAG: SIS domain-containing protein [Alphaproteobacteria bacterium]
MSTLSNQISGLERGLLALSSVQYQSLMDEAISCCVVALRSGLPMLVCGNGGSAADAQHIAGELVGRFLRARKALNVRALTTDTSVITAWANDVNYETVFSRQVEAYGQEGGILLALSTSGASRNVLAAAEAARRLGMTVVALTGEAGGPLKSLADVAIAVPSKETPRIQEMHMMLYHYLCERVEAAF